MCQDQDSLLGQMQHLLGDHGVVPCLFALAHALRGENDKADPSQLPPEAIQTATVREYLANQLAGLAAFWRIQVPPAEKR